MLAEIAIAVVIDGRPIDGSRPATLQNGVVMAPLDPYVRRLADRIETAGPMGRIVVTRGDTTVTVAIGSPFMRGGNAVQAVPIAPFVRGGEPISPLAAIVRALGGSVTYDTIARVLYVQLSRGPLAQMTPFGRYEPPSDAATFTPNPSPAPRVVVTGAPRPRRTPIVVEGKLP